MPAAGPASVSIGGIPWFPNFNNNGGAIAETSPESGSSTNQTVVRSDKRRTCASNSTRPLSNQIRCSAGLTWLSCEVDACNAHAGKGFDYHCALPLSSCTDRCESTSSHSRAGPSTRGPRPPCLVEAWRVCRRPRGSIWTSVPLFRRQLHICLRPPTPDRVRAPPAHPTTVLQQRCLGACCLTRSPRCCSSLAFPSTSPPAFSYGLDGIPIFGRYLFSASPGFATDLDQCGGHTHSGVGDPYILDGGYHYHAFYQTVTGTQNGGASATYTAHANGPYLCFKGNISTIPNFWTGGPTTQNPCASCPCQIPLPPTPPLPRHIPA